MTKSNIRKPRHEHIGLRSGMLTIIGIDYAANKPRFVCRCTCGNTTKTATHTTLTGRVAHCGCIPARQAGPIKAWARAQYKFDVQMRAVRSALMKIEPDINEGDINRVIEALSAKWAPPRPPIPR